MSSIYIHIPFCDNICSYCDFCKFYYNKDFVSKYLNELDKEISIRYKRELISTIYIGGGTPSSLSIDELQKLLIIVDKVNKNKNYEYTIECNVENITEEKLLLMKKFGVNRLSIGVQTFNESHLRFLNRHHTKKSGVECIKLAQQYFDNINVDIMYAIPNQTLKDLERDIDILLDLNIKHISTYSLIIEKHTMISNTKSIDQDLDYDMYLLIRNKLKKSGYVHYEISNFSKKGYESKHNLTYWNNNEYYGFGIGASGYIDNIRYDNTKSINNYLNGNYKYEEHKLNKNETIQNEFILGFRKMNGIDKDVFKKKYNIEIKSIQAVDKLLNEKKLLENKSTIYINPKYIYTSNDILLEFIDLSF